uniref:E3 ubiquitin protein ligase upl2, putative n=1 Tax=Arundo donax TaxID=35708 RepID=A0A0A9E6B5_ARUDO
MAPFSNLVISFELETLSSSCNAFFKCSFKEEQNARASEVE